MSTTTTHLNLARKWRSKQFDQIIGQDLSIRILKNSLYLNQFFPVYLFSGQRGCGKTTTARVFASAINCEQYEQFRKEPKKHFIPCLSCDSCQAMLIGKHPDFIEMDAASHTGVDNVRQIIDASSLLPLMGGKKIYLIDEAHMLSKAAFNAFLKILEEPPTSVLFILATTDPQKIIETVRSRCFQLFFKPIASSILLQHLVNVCKQEGIAYEQAGLDLIIKETEGSARDALNMLETVRFSTAKVSKDAVLQILGHVEDERIIALLKAVLLQDSAAVLNILHSIDRTHCSALFLWNSFLRLMRACIWLKHGVKLDTYNEQIPALKKMLQSFDWTHLHKCLDHCYCNETIFLKTTDQHAYFEMLLLQLCVVAHRQNNDDSASGMPSTTQAPRVHAVEQEEDDEELEDEQEEDIIDEDVSEFASIWNQCIQDIASLDDPLVTSIFKQSTFLSFDEKKAQLEVQFAQKFVFFKDWLETTEHIWLPILQQRFHKEIQFNPHFTGKDHALAVNKKSAEPIVLEKKQQPTPSSYQSTNKKNSSLQQRSFGYTKKKSIQKKKLDISVKEKWQKTHLLLRYFPGTVYEVQEQVKNG